LSVSQVVFLPSITQVVVIAHILVYHVCSGYRFSKMPKGGRQAWPRFDLVCIDFFKMFLFFGFTVLALTYLVCHHQKGGICWTHSYVVYGFDDNKHKCNSLLVCLWACCPNRSWIVFGIYLHCLVNNVWEQVLEQFLGSTSEHYFRTVLETAPKSSWLASIT